MDKFEQKMQHRQIEAFVDAEEISVELWRKDRMELTSGGYGWGDPYQLPAQRARLVPYKRRYTEIVVNTQYGDVPELQYLLIFPTPDANIKREDWFFHEGARYEVESIDEVSKLVRTAAEVIYKGTEDG